MYSKNYSQNTGEKKIAGLFVNILGNDTFIIINIHSIVHPDTAFMSTTLSYSTLHKINAKSHHQSF